MKILIFFSLLFNVCASHAQTSKVALDIFEEGIKLNDIINVSICTSKKLYKIALQDSLLNIPDSLYGKKMNLYVETRKYKLNFQDLYIGWNNNYLKWSIYIDYPPYYKKWIVKGQLCKKKYIYAIDRGNGTTIVYWVCSKNKKNG